MHLDLTRVKGPRDHVERRYRADAFGAAGDDYRVVGDVGLSFDIEKKDDRYRLVGRTTAELELTCGRCVERFCWPVDAAFDLTYLPQSHNVGEGEREVGDEDLDAAFYEHEAIDLGQLVREQLYLSLPMKPLCQPNCQGLCVVCGTNRNTGTCSCDPKWEDPRLAPLKGLLGKPPAAS